MHQRNEKNEWMMKVTVAVTYTLMIVMNALANILPLNNIGTGEVSDTYANLFAPAGITFAIWAIIYLALGGHVVFQFRQKFYSPETGAMIQKMRVWFSISSVANILWIFSWHYDRIGLSVIWMLMILFSLINCNLLLHSAKLTAHERRWIQVPFSLYFGWITIATIANITTWLVSLNWNGFGLREDLWTSVILLVGLSIAARTILKFRDITYGVVILWAFAGILIKHTSQSGFDGAYPMVVATVSFAIVATIASLILISYQRIEVIRKKFRN